ncbi:hypothetical protein BCR22_12445 [Enterococcus plantarum]|nr:hypothetical protein BCR22_12445 [Enterococcus plantarum]
MKKKIFFAGFIVLSSSLLLSVGQADTALATGYSDSINYSLQQKDPNEILGSTNWQGTIVTDEQGNDVTSQNSNFIGLAKYDANSNHYEFFDATTGQTRNDRGTFFITQDGKKRILFSELGYNVAVDMVELNNDVFTYSRTGKQADGSDGKVIVEHVPYAGALEFTTTLPELTTQTGSIDRSKEGRKILSDHIWQGTVALDKEGRDVSAYNQSYLGLARYDDQTGRYEFFDKTTGQTRGDYGYFDVVRDNKVRASLSLGMNYGAQLELTEINDQRFTYTRQGKDAQGNDIPITVEHERYTGEFPLDFTFGEEEPGVDKTVIDVTQFTNRKNKNPLLNPIVKEAIEKNTYTLSGLSSSMTADEVAKILDGERLSYSRRIYGNAQQVQRFISTNNIFEYVYFAGATSNTMTINFDNLKENAFKKMYPTAKKIGNVYLINENVSISFEKNKQSVTFKNF